MPKVILTEIQPLAIFDNVNDYINTFQIYNHMRLVLRE